MDADYFRLLFDYNCWANHLVIDRAAEVRESDYFGRWRPQLWQPSRDPSAHPGRGGGLARPLGRGAAGEAQRRQKSGPIGDYRDPTFKALTELWRAEEAGQRRFFSALTDEAVSHTISYKNAYDEPNEQPLSRLIAHLVNHGTQFRAEAAVRLTQLGLSPGDHDLIIFLRQGTR